LRSIDFGHALEDNGATERTRGQGMPRSEYRVDGEGALSCPSNVRKQRGIEKKGGRKGHLRISDEKRERGVRWEGIYLSN